MRKQSGVIKSYYGGFSSSGVVRIKISLFAGRFRHPHPVMFLPIFKGMSEAWQCTSSEIPQRIVLWGINNIYCHIWALVWATGLHFFFFFRELHVYVLVSLNFLGKIIPSRPSGQLRVTSKPTHLSSSDNFPKALSINGVTPITAHLIQITFPCTYFWKLLNVRTPGNSWPNFIVVKSILSFLPPRGSQPQLQTHRMG